MRLCCVPIVRCCQTNNSSLPCRSLRLIIFDLTSPLLLQYYFLRLGVHYAPETFPPLLSLTSHSPRLPYDDSLSLTAMAVARVARYLTSVAKSPLVQVYVYRYVELKMESWLAYQLYSSILQPTNPDRFSTLASIEPDNRSTVSEQPQQQAESTDSIIHKLMHILGWNIQYQTKGRRPLLEQPDDVNDHPRQAEQSREHNIDATTGSELESTSSSDSIEVAANPSRAGPERNREGGRQQHTRDTATRHRCTDLSNGPADALTQLMKENITGMVMLPMRFIMFRHLLTSAGMHPLKMSFLATSEPATATAYVPRLVLCSAVDLLVGLSVCTLETALSKSLGKRMFGWGQL